MYSYSNSYNQFAYICTQNSSVIGTNVLRMSLTICQLSQHTSYMHLFALYANTVNSPSFSLYSHVREYFFCFTQPFNTFSYSTLLICSNVLVEQLIEHTPLRGTEMSYDRDSFYRSIVAFIPRECKIHTGDTFVLSRCYSFT
jgi:hypothetical protein